MLPTATVSGCVLASVPTAGTSAIVVATGCTCATVTANSCSVTSIASVLMAKAVFEGVAGAGTITPNLLVHNLMPAQMAI